MEYIKMCGRVKAWLQKTGLPNELICIIFIIILMSFVALSIDLYEDNNNKSILTITYEYAVILTLVVLIFYVYYTFLLAKYQIVPSASFELVQAQDDPYHFGFKMVNYGKYPVECWCDLNATTSGVPLKYKGFYSGNEPRLLKPMDGRMGHFRITDLLMNTKYKISSLESDANSENFKQLLHLNIKFWYVFSSPESLA
jgi:hypothetical protein